MIDLFDSSIANLLVKQLGSLFYLLIGWLHDTLVLELHPGFISDKAFTEATVQKGCNWGYTNLESSNIFKQRS